MIQELIILNHFKDALFRINIRVRYVVLRKILEKIISKHGRQWN